MTFLDKLPRHCRAINVFLFFFQKGQQMQNNKIDNIIKRLFDITSSLFAIIVFSPVLIALTILIKIDSSGPVFYRGERVGYNGKIFRIYKFRTMVANADKIGGPSTSDSDARITKIGRIMRKSKLDELPQLFNVLFGEMSLVGPRPEVKYYTDMFNDEEKYILSVRPGITDWASLANPDEGAILAKYDDPDLAYEEIIRPEKIRLQLKYVYEKSFLSDIGIIWQTLITVMSRDKNSKSQ